MKGYRQNEVRLLLRILFRRVQENGQLLVFAEIGEVRFAFDFKMGTTIQDSSQTNLRSC